MSREARTRAGRDLAGARILLVEDEPVIALDFTQVPACHGAMVIGPAAELAEALALLAGHPGIDAAVLDVHLIRQDAWPIAEALVTRGIPFVFTTGTAAVAIPAAYAVTPCLLKPFEPQDLVELLAGMCRARAGSSAATPITVRRCHSTRPVGPGCATAHHCSLSPDGAAPVCSWVG